MASLAGAGLSMPLIELKFRDEEGYTPVLAAIERDKDDRYEVLKLILSSGADVNGKGINDYTPAHLAALRDDVEALKKLVKFGADLTIRTNIDLYATPLEEAKHFKCKAAIEFLKSVA
jgi:ankyrin repeat protein